MALMATREAQSKEAKLRITPCRAVRKTTVAI